MHEKSVTLLNQAVGDELAAVHQYMYWHFHLDDQGFAPLAALLKRIAMMEMVHTERLAEQAVALTTLDGALSDEVVWAGTIETM